MTGRLRKELIALDLDAMAEEVCLRSENLKALLHEVFREAKDYAPGWNQVRLERAILGIERHFCVVYSIPRNKQKAIAKRAKNLLDEIADVPGISEVTLGELKDLASLSEVRVGRGGNRRSAEHSVNAIGHRMIVRLYIDAHQKPGFSSSGPLKRFVLGVCDLLQMPPPRPSLAEDALKGVFNSVKKEMEMATRGRG